MHSLRGLSDGFVCAQSVVVWCDYLVPGEESASCLLSLLQNPTHQHVVQVGQQQHKAGRPHLGRPCN